MIVKLAYTLFSSSLLRVTWPLAMRLRPGNHAGAHVMKQEQAICMIASFDHDHNVFHKMYRKELY